MRRILRIILIVLCLSFAIAASGATFQEEVDWMWSDTKPTVRTGCKNFVVKAGPPKILRGRTSGQACLEQAIEAYQKGDHEKAFGWILAGQCHNRQARETLVRNAPIVLSYLLEKYGQEIK